MEIEINHNPQIFFNKYNLKWKIANKNKNEIVNFYFFISICFLLFAIYLLIQGSNFGLMVLTAAFLLMIYFGYYRVSLIKYKSKYFEALRANSEQYLKSSLPIIFNFNDENFIYSDCLQSISFNWSVFNSYAIIENILFLKRDNNLNNAITIFKEEVGEENFSKIVEFVKTKI